MSTLTNRDFSELYQKYGPMVLRRCRFILKDEEKALDAMQDVFLKIIENKYKVKDVCSSLFYVTATYVCLNKIRSDKLRTGPCLDELSEVIADELSEKENQKIEAAIILEKIFEERDQKDALIATLHYVDGLTLEETAEHVGMSVSGIRKKMNNLKKYSISLLNSGEVPEVRS